MYWKYSGKDTRQLRHCIQHICRHMSLGFTATLQHWKNQYKETKGKTALKENQLSHTANHRKRRQSNPDYCIDLSAQCFSSATIVRGENIWTDLEQRYTCEAYCMADILIIVTWKAWTYSRARCRVILSSIMCFNLLFKLTVVV